MRPSPRSPGLSATLRHNTNNTNNENQSLLGKDAKLASNSKRQRVSLGFISPNTPPAANAQPKGGKRTTESRADRLQKLENIAEELRCEEEFPAQVAKVPSISPKSSKSPKAVAPKSPASRSSSFSFFDPPVPTDSTATTSLSELSANASSEPTVEDLKRQLWAAETKILQLEHYSASLRTGCQRVLEELEQVKEELTLLKSRNHSEDERNNYHYLLAVNKALEAEQAERSSATAGTQNTMKALFQSS